MKDVGLRGGLRFAGALGGAELLPLYSARQASVWRLRRVAALRALRSYRDGAQSLAKKLGMMLMVLEFDRARFDVAAYQEGASIEHGKEQPSSEWTFSYLQSLLDDVFWREGKKLPYCLAGPSAGA